MKCTSRVRGAKPEVIPQEKTRHFVFGDSAGNKQNNLISVLRKKKNNKTRDKNFSVELWD